MQKGNMDEKTTRQHRREKLPFAFPTLSAVTAAVSGVGIYSLSELTAAMGETEKAMDSLPVVTGRSPTLPPCSPPPGTALPPEKKRGSAPIR